ncbi:hypothetical protein AcidC75_13350 [Acidisoma sp. C75]
MACDVRSWHAGAEGFGRQILDHLVAEVSLWQDLDDRCAVWPPPLRVEVLIKHEVVAAFDEQLRWKPVPVNLEMISLENVARRFSAEIQRERLAVVGKDEVAFPAAMDCVKAAHGVRPAQN